MKDTRKIDNLVLNDKNPRGIKKKDFERLKKQIQKLGMYKPVLITPQGKVLGGNMRVRAYKELGIKDIWVSVVDPKNETEEMEYILSDNDRAGYWEEQDLAELITSLPELELGTYAIDIGEPKDLNDFMKEFSPEEVTEDEAPEVSDEEPVSVLGEVYQLGRHRLMCGDSTKIEDVELLMNGQKAELLFTSPPYADMREYGGGKELSVEHLASFIPTWRMFTDYQVVNLGLKRENGEVVQYWNEYIKQAKESGLKLLSWNVWNRESATSIGMQTAFFPIFHEWLFVFGSEERELNRTQPKSDASYERQKYESAGTRRQADGSLKESNKGNTSYNFVKIGTVTTLKPANTIGMSEHPAMYPVQLPSEYIEAMTDENDIVAEPFGGSGSTLIACEQLDRTCYMMEIDPKYCDVIRKRYAKFIGKETEWEQVSPKA